MTAMPSSVSSAAAISKERGKFPFSLDIQKTKSIEFLLQKTASQRRKKMAFELPDLPFADTALEPHISAKTLSFHYGKHHNAYVTNLNKLTEGSDLADKSLEEIIASSDLPAGVFNNAAQVWNHSFYWNCLAPDAGGDATGAVAEAINAAFGSFADFKDAFSKSAATNFGSGWTWLVKNDDGSVVIENTSNADTPIAHGRKVVLTIDVWEHAYYVDYKNARPKYVEAYWNLVNWDFVNSNM
jgi:Fe-Mn family superoxide dismutase